MIQFPETAEREWASIAAASDASVSFRQRIAREAEVANAVERMHVTHEARLQFQREIDAENTPPLEMMTLAEYAANPAFASGPSDMIDGVVKEKGLCTVLGPSGAGKTTLALQMAYSALTGTDFLGQPTKKIKGAVGIMSYDSDWSILNDWMLGAPGIPTRKISVVNAYRQGNPMAVPDQRKQIASAWRAMNVEVVLVDSFSASFFGVSQNDATDTMTHYRDLKAFALTEVGAKVVIVIAHSSAGSPLKARGSTVHVDAADTILGVTVDDQNRRHAQMVKYRAARGQTEMAPLILGKPDSVTHLVGVDAGAMQLSGMDIPAGLEFAALPETINEPDIESDFGEDIDL